MTTIFLFAVCIEVISFSIVEINWHYLSIPKLHTTLCVLSDETTIYHTIKFLPFTINCTMSNKFGAKVFTGTNLKMKTRLSTSFTGFRVNTIWPGDCWFMLPKRRPLYWDTSGMIRPFLPRMNRVTSRAIDFVSFVPHSTLCKSPVYFHEKLKEEPSFATLLLLL